MYLSILLAVSCQLSLVLAQTEGESRSPVEPMVISTWAATVPDFGTATYIPKTYYTTMPPQYPTKTPSAASYASSKGHRSVIIALSVIFSFVGVCILAAAILTLMRYRARRAAVERRRHASWILRINQQDKAADGSGSQDVPTDIKHNPISHSV